MSDAESKEIISSRSWGSKAPWPFVLLFIITALFFTGGYLLDLQASNIRIDTKSLFPSMETKTDPSSGKDITTKHEVVLDAKDREMLIEFEKAKAQRLNESAKLLYDFAKIALGALLTTLSQMISYVTQRGRETSNEQAAKT